MASRKIPTVQERRKQRHDQMIADILTIAREMMQADGVAALSFNAIAYRLGIKPPSLYTYFDSKHDIYDRLFREGFETFDRHMKQGVEQSEDVKSFIKNALVSYMTFALENPDLFQLMFQRPVPGFVPSEESMNISLGALHNMRHDLQKILEGSDLQIPQSIEQTGDLIIAMIHGLTELQLANNPESPVGEGRYGRLIDHAVQLFTNDLLA